MCSLAVRPLRLVRLARNGMVGNGALLKVAPLEERIYRHRCVEAWSIVVPWIGYSLNNIVKAAQIIRPTTPGGYGESATG